MNSYVLIVDDEEDILEIHEITVKSFYTGEVILATSGNKAWEIIEKKGPPLIIICDYKMADGDGVSLFTRVIKNNISSPFIVCSGNPEDQLREFFPNCYGILTKPNIIKPLKLLINEILGKLEPAPKFVPISISHILKTGYTDYDFFIKLSHQKYIKVLIKGEPFIAEDAERFFKKSLASLYISQKDAEEFLKQLEKYLELKFRNHNDKTSDISFPSEAIESVEMLAKGLGWTPDCLELAKKTLNFAIKAIAQEQDLMRLLKQKSSLASSHYSRHVSMLAIFSSAFCQKIGWTSESTQMKLAMAALLHDLDVDDDIYNDIDMWNDLARNDKDKKDKVLKYRNHPIEAANIIKKMKSLPPDVDNIVLQHHERPDGQGFPRCLSSSRVSPLSALFIIIEDLINHIDEKHVTSEFVLAYLNEREEYYLSGNFRKVFQSLKNSLQA